MLKQSSIETRRKFLNNFTNEILAIVKHKKDSELRAREARERINTEREVVRLSRKYIKPKKIVEPIIPISEDIMKPISDEEEIKKEVLKKPESRHKPVERPFTRPISPRPPQHQRPMPIYKPTPSIAALHQTPFDLRKIQVLIEDKEVTSIECQGEDKELIIKKRGQLMKTEIKLKKEDIAEVIRQFSERARIPLIEGLLRARVEDLQISAVVSNVASSRFIITRVVLQLAPTPIILNQKFQRVPTQFKKPPVPVRQQVPAPRPVMPPVQRPFMPGPKPLASIAPLPAVSAQQPPQPIVQQQMPTQQPQQPMAPPPQLPQPMIQPPTQPPQYSIQPILGEDRSLPGQTNRLEGMQPSISSQEPVVAKEVPAPEKPREIK